MDNGTFLSCWFARCWYARSAAVSGRPRCARYGLGRRSLTGGSHTHPTLAVAWAVFAANGGRTARALRAPSCARNAACGRQRRIPQELCSPRPVGSPAACAVRPHHPRNPHRASVSSAFMRKKRASPHPAAHIAGPFARTLPQRFGEPQLSKLKSESPVPSPNLRFGEGIPRERGTGCPLPAGGLPR